jgi:hypothetical protein
MADIIGRRTGGRALSTGRKHIAEQASAPLMGESGTIEGLTPEQVDTMGPREVLMRAMRRALLDGVLPLATKIATDLMPYFHAKKTPVKDQDPDAPSAEDIAGDTDPKVKD